MFSPAISQLLGASCSRVMRLRVNTVRLFCVATESSLDRTSINLDLPSNVVVPEETFNGVDSLFADNVGQLDIASLGRSDTTVKHMPVAKMEVGALHSDPVAEVTLENSVFGVPIRRDLVHRVVCWQRANRRQVKSGGLVKVKNRAEVSGGGRKPWKQKGSGRARHGSIRSPIWRGGGKAHGPRQNRVWSQKLNKKIVQLGIKTALAAKWREGNIAVVDEAVMPTRKTSALVKAIEAHGWVGKKGILFVRGTDEVDENFYWASRNIPYLTVISSENCNVYDLLLREQCVVTVSALDELTERLNRRPGLWHSGARSLKSRDEICSAQQLQHSTQTGTEAKEHEILNDLNTNMVLGSVLQGMKSRFGVETYAEALAVCQKEIENHSDVSESEMLDDNEVGFYEVAQELLSEMRELDVEDEEALKLLAEMQIKNVDNFLDASN